MYREKPMKAKIEFEFTDEQWDNGPSKLLEEHARQLLGATLREFPVFGIDVDAPLPITKPILDPVGGHVGTITITH